MGTEDDGRADGMGELMIDEAVELAMALGDVDEAERGKVETLCRAAVEEFSRRLRDGVEAGDCAPALALAAAWTALADLCVGACADGVESFTAGAVTVRQGEKLTALERSEGLRRRAELAMAPYLEDRGFFFRGVRG